QAAAELGTVTVGGRTMRATAEAVVYRELPPLTLKGKRDPVPAWEARAVAAAMPDRRGLASRSPLVGRAHEIELLESVAQRVVRERRPHIVTVVGGAGVGKSRLLLELERRLAERPDGPIFRTGRCLAYGSGVVYWALGEVLREEFGIDDADTAEIAWRKLADGVEQRLGHADGAEAARQAATIARLLGIGSQEAPELAVDDDPQRLRESSFAA